MWLKEQTSPMISWGGSWYQHLPYIYLKQATLRLLGRSCSKDGWVSALYLSTVAVAPSTNPSKHTPLRLWAARTRPNKGLSTAIAIVVLYNTYETHVWHVNTQVALYIPENHNYSYTKIHYQYTTAICARTLQRAWSWRVGLRLQAHHYVIGLVDVTWLLLPSALARGY